MAAKKKSGGQKGHPGHTLKKVEHPDHVVPCSASIHCEDCHRPLPDGEVVETRQVFDIPRPRAEVTEYQMIEARCTCGKVHRGELAGFESFCTIRSYLATIQKQGINTFDALTSAFKGSPALPRFA